MFDSSRVLLNEEYDDVELSILYSKYIGVEAYGNFRNNAFRCLLLVSEHIFFSRVKIVKSKTRAPVVN